MPVAQLEAVRAQHIDEPFPDGESYRQVVDRVREFLGDIATEFEHGRIVLISHSAPRWALQHRLCGLALEDLVAAPFAWQPGWRFVLRTAADQGDYMEGGPA
jgi:broad specificity phosphatase PhoE